MKMKQKMMEKGVENEPKMPTVNNPIYTFSFHLCMKVVSCIKTPLFDVEVLHEFLLFFIKHIIIKS